MKKIIKNLFIITLALSFMGFSGCKHSAEKQDNQENTETSDEKQDEESEEENDEEPPVDYLTVDISTLSKYDTVSETESLVADWDWDECNISDLNTSDFDFLQIDYENADAEFVYGVVYNDDSKTESSCFRYSTVNVIKLDSDKKGSIKKIFLMSKTEAVSFKINSITFIKSTDFFDPVADEKESGNFTNSSSSINFAKKMKVGWNMGNVLDCYTGAHDLSSELAWKEPYTTKEIVELGKNNDFTTIRIPITWSNHFIDENYTLDPQWMKRVKQIVDWAYDAGYYVIINEHHSDNEGIGKIDGVSTGKISKCGGYMVTFDDENIAESKAFLKAVWEQICTAFNNSYDEHLIFETQNEPADHFHPACPGYPNCSNHEYDKNHHIWGPLEDDAATCEKCLKDFQVNNEYNQLILDTIRASGGNNAKRYVMIPGMGTSVRSPLMSQFKMPTDSATDRLMLTVHDYTMGEYAHAIKSEFTDAEEELLLSKFYKLYNAYVKNGIPVILGETGWEHVVYDTFDENDEGISGPDVSPSERVEWITSLSKMTSSYGMPLIYWDVGTDRNKMGELDRVNLRIKTGEEAFVRAMLSNWDLSNTPVIPDSEKNPAEKFEDNISSAISLLSNPVQITNWSDASFSCSVSSDKLTGIKEGSIIKIKFKGEGFKNFAITKYRDWNSIPITGEKYSELCDFSDGNNFTYSNGNSPLYIRLSQDDAEEFVNGFTIQGMNLTVTGILVYCKIDL